MAKKTPSANTQTDQSQPHQRAEEKQDKFEQEIQALTEVIADLKKQLEEKDVMFKRAVADYMNLQRRTQDERQQFVKLATAGVFQSMLEPLDHLEMTAAHLKDQTLTMVLKQLMNALYANGLQEVDALGRPFDPQTMEAAESVDGEKETVIKVRRRGYLVNGQLLRPALVEVGNGNVQKLSDTAN